MRVLSRKLRQSRCRHRTTISIHTLGFERVVCESCGNVDVHMPDGGGAVDTEVDRAAFARPSDLESDEPLGRHRLGE
jgi:ribosomal protein S27E